MAKFQQKHPASLDEANNGSPEKDLWNAVLSKAVDDAFFTSNWKESLNSIDWIESKNRNFRLVCEMAGRNPDYVYRKILKKITDRKQELINKKNHIRNLQDLGIMKKYGERSPYRPRKET